jgi:hypothetical protein
VFVGRGIGAAAAAFGSSPLNDGLPRQAVAEWSGLAARESRAIIACIAALVALSGAALLRNYQMPKQDFSGAVQFLDGAEAEGAQVAVAGPSCFLFEPYFGRPWPCVATLDDWLQLGERQERVLVLHTLSEYIDDRPLLENLTTNCPLVRRFPGTLDGGDLIVCQRQDGALAASRP